MTLVSATRACDPEKIRMTPTVEPGQFTKAPVKIGLVVSSTEKTACTLTPADADMVAVISANKTPIWDSTVCKVALLDDPVSISPQWATLVTATWSGRGSGCQVLVQGGLRDAGHLHGADRHARRRAGQDDASRSTASREPKPTQDHADEAEPVGQEHDEAADD